MTQTMQGSSLWRVDYGAEFIRKFRVKLGGGAKSFCL